MRRKKFKLLRSLLGAAFTFTCLSGFAQNVKAEVIKLDRENPIIEAKNNLIIEKDMKKKPTLNVTVEGNSIQVVKKAPSTVFQQNYDAFMVSFNDVTVNGLKNTKLKLNYNYVGTYNGRAISSEVVYSNIIPMTGFSLDDKPRFEISANMYSGYWYNNIRYSDTTIKFFYEDNKEVVDFQGDSYMTFNSLNKGEFVQYTNQVAGKKIYITNDSNVGEIDIPVSGVGGGKSLMGQSDEFEDKLGSKTFKRNSASFQISGKELKFKIGYYKDITPIYVWNSYNSATLFNTPSENPVKSVLNEKGESINKEPVKAGQLLTYSIEQKVHTLGIDLLERYSKFEIMDSLPEKVTYKKAWLAEDSKGTFTYDEKNHVVKYQASKNFLDTMKLNGEKYKLNIQVQVNEDIRASDILKNQATVSIDSNKKETNEVENKGIDPKGAFTIYKVTDQLTGFENETLLPKYEEKPQADVSYQITAEEHVTLTDGTLVAEKDSDFGKITTNEEGVATKKDIYAGKYKAVEVAAPIGIQIDPTPIIIDVVSNKATATGNGEQKDPLQEIELRIHKSFEKEDGTFEEVGGAKFGLFHAINHKIDDKNVILKDTLVSEIEIDEKGLGTYKGILIPEQQYYIKEISTKEGYQLNQEKFYFSYIPVSNDAVHMIELYGNGYIDADVKKDYKTERNEKSENKNPEETSGEHLKESTSQSNKEQTEESSTDKSKEDIELIDIKNLLIKENNIVKSILKEDGSKLDHYELLSNGEKVMFEGLVYIGDNEKIESLKVVDELPNGFSFEESKVYDESGNDITNQTTIKNEGQKVTLEIKNEYVKELRRTSIRWVIRTTYKFSMDHKEQVFENQMHLILNDKDVPSNIVTLTPPNIEEKPVVQKPKGILPNTGEMQGYLSVAGVALVLCIVAFWYTRSEKNPEDESNDKTE